MTFGEQSMALTCPYCHRKIQIPVSETEITLFPCPNCGGSIDLARIEGDDDSKVVYLSEGDLIEPHEADADVSPRTWTDQGPLPHREPRHFHLFRWLAVMLGVIMLIPLLFGYFFLKTTTNKDHVITLLNSYFSEIDHRNYRNAFRKYMASDLQRKISLEGYLREMEEMRRKLGGVKHRDLMRWSYRSMNREKSCTLSYNSSYERGNAEERYTLVKAKDGWKISEFRIDPHPTKSKKGMVEI
jgi:predicted RNA-binding Zn-ribbon protein involved in translation (DUF1610 family)